MKNGFPHFSLGVRRALPVLGACFVLGPQLQLGGLPAGAGAHSSDVYPTASRRANQGLAVYSRQRCAACHTEQVQQTGVECEVIC